MRGLEIRLNAATLLIHHQNADAMVLASARLRGIPPGRLPFHRLHPPWTSAKIIGKS